ncbi:MAG: hypothetical protein PHF64_11400 [Methanoregula sp.]|nr:hypothetical protein [Methanoregula sp.]
MYEDNDAKQVGSGTETYNTLASFTTGITTMMANTTNNTAHGA